jgi:DNA end-binding protein Ku
MPARSIGTGTVSFGLVSIPVKLYSPTDSKASISFNMLHAKCGSRLKQQYVCTKDGELVPRDQMAKGYEFSKDQYVLFTEDEIKALQEETQKAIEITEFIPVSKVDPIYFDGAYYLGPDKGAERAYRLLSAAMKETGRVAVARWISRGKQHVVLIRPFSQGLVMQELHYQDELKPFDEVPIPDANVLEPELKLGVMLIEQIARADFEMDKYRDEVRERMQAAIQRKIEGHEIQAAPEAPKAQIIDLMEALKASLAGKAPAAASEATTAPDAEAAPVSMVDRKPAKRSPRSAGEKAERKKAAEG